MKLDQLQQQNITTSIGECGDMRGLYAVLTCYDYSYYQRSTCHDPDVKGRGVITQNMRLPESFPSASVLSIATPHPTVIPSPSPNFDLLRRLKVHFPIDSSRALVLYNQACALIVFLQKDISLLHLPCAPLPQSSRIIRTPNPLTSWPTLLER
jgi:hypothetical protein